MILTDSYLRIALGSNLQPVGDDVSGSLHIGRDVTTLLPTCNLAWRARLHSNGGTASVDFYTGSITPSAAPVAQVETATVTAAAGCTNSGALAYTITGAHIPGSPLAISVPLVTGVHTTAALIAAAIRNTMAAEGAITNQYTVGGTGASITLTRLLTRDGLNDATLNIATAGGLGVSAAASSANTTAGVRGVSVDRLGGDGKDLTGVALPTMSTPMALALFVDALSNDYCEFTKSAALVLPKLDPGSACVMCNSFWLSNSLDVSTPYTFGTAGKAFAIDILLFGYTSA